MRILGINKGTTLTGKNLRFGSSAIYNNGSVIALGEERISGVKHAGGYNASLQALLDATGLKIDRDFDHIAISTCCESRTAALYGHPLASHERLLAVQHHFSHASLAYYGSGFDECLVAVADGGGNTFHDSGQPTDRWWHEPREQSSYYLASKGRLELIDQDFEAPFDVGLGEIYRAFTYFLGWHSSRHASKTMALAGHGDRGALAEDVYYLSDGRLITPLRNDPTNPIDMVRRLGDLLNLDFGEPRTPGQAILGIHRNVAAFAQKTIESAFIRKLAYLQRRLKIDRACVAGGLAHNVVLNGHLFELFPEGVYVPSAPGDEGQSLGNIYALLSEVGAGSKAPSMRSSSDVHLGPPMKIDSTTVATCLKDARLSSYVVFETTDFSHLMAGFLASRAVVCLYQERSEFGPRALGSRSILADPRRADVTSELNILKQREWFMPFAPVVLRHRMDEWFMRSEASPFMSFAVEASPRARGELPAVVNADGTSRVQTVDENDGQPITRILINFAKQTGVPALLNTSFNLGGQPIVESISQALNAFSKMPINVLGIGRFVVIKALSPALSDLPLEGSIRELDLQVCGAGSKTKIDTADTAVSSVIRRLQLLTDSVVFVRTELPLYGQYLGWLREGRKVTTIRFRKNAVEVPISGVLPLFETDDYSPGDRSRPTDYVRVTGIRYQRFGDLSSQDAQRDGFESLEHMRGDLYKIYPHMVDEDWVTIYNISLAGD